MPNITVGIGTKTRDDLKTCYRKWQEKWPEEKYTWPQFLRYVVTNGLMDAEAALHTNEEEEDAGEPAPVKKGKVKVGYTIPDNIS